MAIIRVEKDLSHPEPLTEKQIKMLQDAKKRTPVYDEDNPPLTKEQLSEFRRAENEVRGIFHAGER